MSDMKEIYFIHPNPNKSTPRGIRVINIVKNLQQNAPENNYSIICFSDKIKSKPTNSFKINSLNLIYILFKYSGVFKYGKRFSKLSKVLDPYIFIHFLIKIDLKVRLRKIEESTNIVFVVVISPFSNYLLVPWLRKKYPDANIVCDIGDPLYNNNARWNEDELSRKIEANAVREASSLIVTNHLTKSHFEQEFIEYNPKINIVPQGVDLSLIEEALEKSCCKKYTLAYAGRFYNELRSPDQLFLALSSQKEYILNIYGNNVISKIKNINFQGNFSQKNLFKKLANNEILVFIDNKYGIQTSGKIYELLAFRKPILFIKGDEDSPTYYLSKKFSNVFFCENEKNSILNSLKLLYDRKDKIETYKSNQFSWFKRADNFFKILNR